jgi:hypothetical protein
MVKADPKQDYYGDLGLPASADQEEIKKQFRLLGPYEFLQLCALLIYRSKAISSRSEPRP